MRLAQLELRVRDLAKRNAALEARVAALEADRRPRQKRPTAPRPDDVVIMAREKLWSRYVLLHVGHRGRITYTSFAVKYHLGHPSELSRFFNCTGRRGIAEGSATAVRFYRALHEAISETQARKAHAPDFHGIVADSHSSGARPQ